MARSLRDRDHAGCLADQVGRWIQCQCLVKRIASVLAEGLPGQRYGSENRCALAWLQIGREASGAQWLDFRWPALA